MIDPIHEDRRLVSALLRGDSDAFDEFIDEYYPRLYRFAYSRLKGNPEEVDEIVQGSLVKVLENLERFRGEASLFTWICSFCRYEIAAMWRSKYGRGDPVELREDLPDVRAALEALSITPSTPDEELERVELARLIRSILDHLPPKYARVLEMKYLARLQVKEIARQLRLSPKAAESLLTRARNAFREGFIAVAGDRPSWT